MAFCTRLECELVARGQRGVREEARSFRMGGFVVRCSEHSRSRMAWGEAAVGRNDGEIILCLPCQSIDFFADAFALHQSYLEGWHKVNACIKAGKGGFVSGLVEGINGARLSVVESTR
jgi:hypothetical protein